MSREKCIMPFCVLLLVITIPMEVMWVQSYATVFRSDPVFFQLDTNKLSSALVHFKLYFQGKISSFLPH